MSVVPFRPRSNATRPSPSLSAQSSRQFRRPPTGIRAVGIDLGTTNSVVAVYTEHREQPATLAFADDSFLVPSVVYWDPLSKTESVGRQAIDQAKENIAEIIRSTKRQMGIPGQVFSSHGREYSPEKTATSILQYLASHEQLRTEKDTHGGLWSVITVPAHFDDAARLATIDAAEAAGIHVLRIVNEPTAAALAYSMLPDVRDLDRENLVVYDLGGGTFDVSVVEREGLVFNVLSSEGDVQLGGDDFDHALAEHLVKHVKPELSSRRMVPSSVGFKSLLKLAEEAKRRLQNDGYVHVRSNMLDDSGAAIDVTLGRDVFENLALPFIQKTLSLTERAIHAARKKARDISRILLVGGSTRVTLVRKMLEQYFPHCQVDARLEPDLAVSWGAALQAAIILGLEPQTILVDVCSHSLGVGVAEDSQSIQENYKKIARKFGILGSLSEEQLHTLLGIRIKDFQNELRDLLRVATIIHRNSPLPAKRSEFFNTIYENQPAVQVIVVQGEGEIIGDNRPIGTFLFPLKQPCPAGSQCEIQLTYDQNGMVHVLAKQLGTENQAEAEFDSRTGEVVGWNKLASQNLEVDDGLLTPFEENTERLADVDSGLFNHTDDTFNEEVPHVSEVRSVSGEHKNAFLVKARRHFMRLKPASKEKEILDAIIERYEKLLKRALQGVDCDSELEEIENEFSSQFE